MYFSYCVGLIVCICGVVSFFATSYINLNGIVHCFCIHLIRQVLGHCPGMEQNCLNLTDTVCMSSSVRCVKRLDGTNLCYFKNLYHLPQHKGYLLFFLSEHSVLSGIDSPKELQQIELSTIQNHTGLYLKLVFLKSSEYLLQQNITFSDNSAFIMKRFKPDNIMHVIHDDLIPLFLTFQELCIGNIHMCLSTYQLFFVDDDNEGPYYEWYKYFSNHNPVLLSKLNNAICIQDSIIGLSHGSVWFQYGFNNNQGPLANRPTSFDGFQLKQFSEFIKQQFAIEKEDITLLHKQTYTSIILLSRKINRKILNDYAVEKRIQEIYLSLFNKPVEILNMDLSTNSSKQIILALQKTNLLIGMHGSAMILTIFLPQGSSIIELFPFGIQPEYVSPLKALCSLPNMFYNYKDWVNRNERNTRTHPEYSPLHGGLLHLPILKQQDIMNIKLVPPVKCCHNLVYLYRMFQDTIVDETFYSLVLKTLVNQSEILTEHEFYKRMQNGVFDLWYLPPPVFDLSCKCINKKLTVLWSFPMGASTKLKFSLATSTGIGVITDSTHIAIEMKECEDENINLLESQSTVSVWVKSLDDNKESIDSYVKCIL